MLVLAVVLGWWQAPQAWLYLEADYHTGKGELRTVHLADGSTVELDASSAIGLDFTNSQRRVHLLAGSAVFDLSLIHISEPTRPY